MRIQIGEVAALYRYPVKSMAGERLEVADLGWHGVVGDRRMALRRRGDDGGFPWLTASKCPELLLYVPTRQGAVADGDPPTHIRTPGGQELAAFGPELASEIARRAGSPVEMMHLNRGIFDEASLSVVCCDTINEIARLAAQAPDVRRFRPNIVIQSHRSMPFEEDDWVGGNLSFGTHDDGARIAVTNFDERCSMVNYDPDSARATPEVLKAIVGARNNRAGVYAAVTRQNRIDVGCPVFFEPAAADRGRE